MSLRVSAATPLQLAPGLIVPVIKDADSMNLVGLARAIALEPEDADAMVESARKAKRLLMVAHVLPFFPEYDHARRMIAGGKHGRLLGGHFKRIISDPSWLKDFYNPKKVGGPVVDLHIHDAHFIRLLCGMPQAVFSRGRPMINPQSEPDLRPRADLIVSTGHRGRA